MEKAQSFDDAEGGYLPGTYAAEANGFGGPVTVTVTVGDKGGISNVDIQGPGETPDFGRESGMDADLSQAPYYAIKIAPGIHHTMGGVNIDTGAEVLDTNGNPIPGLFAAGEVTGGVHGGNRIGGSAVADIVVFGKIAAESAVAWCDRQGS